MSMMHNLQHHAKRILAYSSRPRFFCSHRTRTLSSLTNRTLQIRIKTAADNKAAITTVLEQWQQQQLGYHLNPSLVRGIVEKPHDSKSFLKALESYTNSGEKSLSKAESTFDKMRKLGMLLRTSQYNLIDKIITKIKPRLNRRRLGAEEIYEEWEPQGPEFDTGIPG
ncbi:unnamed protein product [Arabidopsis halleri]